MPAKDELAKRRHDNLVARLEAELKPDYQGYYGQLILSSSNLDEMGDLKDIRHAAREAGGRLDRQPKTQLVDGRLFVYDDHEVPEEISRQAMRDPAEAMGAVMRPHMNRAPSNG
ncbi:MULTISPECIES: hypothetical protein [Streptomyces]|uniref:hypothetical protein n=1 Tax=Streptomyces TaxID=1883 RepID=UPI0021D7DD25|nr:hypothetical protein [Streptomyces sp. A13(2022)]MCU8595165.1 hypothetical protein [Streptomyces sp. A13(2022)]